MTTLITEIEGPTRPCPFCGVDILEKALQCSHCRKWQPDVMQAAPPPPAAATSVAARASSRGQTLRHLMLLTVFTGGLYEIYWFYRNWRDLDESDAATLAPRSALLTVGLLVPFVNIALVYRQLDRIRGAVSAQGVQPGYSPLFTTCAYFGLGMLANLTMLWTISLLMVVPLLPVQDALNRYWTEREPGATLRDELTVRELALIALGAAAIVATLLLTWAVPPSP